MSTNTSTTVHFYNDGINKNNETEPKTIRPTKQTTGGRAKTEKRNARVNKNKEKLTDGIKNPKDLTPFLYLIKRNSNKKNDIQAKRLIVEMHKQENECCAHKPQKELAGMSCPNAPTEEVRCRQWLLSQLVSLWQSSMRGLLRI